MLNTSKTDNWHISEYEKLFRGNRKISRQLEKREEDKIEIK